MIPSEVKMVSLIALLICVKIVCGLNLIDSSACPVWYVDSSNDSVAADQCVCRDIEGLVTCVRDVRQVRLSEGVCMTYNNDTEDIEVGKCPYALFDQRYAALWKDQYIYVPKNVTELNQFMCDGWGREDYLCSNCKGGYGLTIANVYINCVECKLPRKIAWLFYFMLELIPLTVLFFILSVFRISLAKPPMNALVLFFQVALALLFTHTHLFHPPYVMDSPWLKGLHRLYLIVLGVWEMTLTRFIETITNFCVDPRISVQQAFIVTQVQSLFPLVLIALTSVGIELHARNCHIIVWLWKPFHKYFVCCTRVWNSKLSLIDVFSTYLLLSYSRFVMQMHYIFSFQYTYKLSNKNYYATRLLYNPSVPYFSSLDHLPYALVLLLIFFVIALPPILLLAFYQFRLFRKVFQCTSVYKSHAIHAFIDLFQGSYKDGINSDYDLRFTASLYLLIRLSVLVCFTLCNFTTLGSCRTVSVFLCVFFLFLFIALVRPYKDQQMNVLDSILLSGLAVISVLFTGMYPTVESQHVNVLILIVILIVTALPLVVLSICIALNFFTCLCSSSLCSSFKVKFGLKLSAEVEMVESVTEQIGGSYSRME